MEKLKKYQLTKQAAERIKEKGLKHFEKNGKKYRYEEMTDDRVEQLWRKIEQSSLYELVPQDKPEKKK